MKTNPPERKQAKLPMRKNAATRLRRAVEGLTSIIAILETPHHFGQTRTIF
jgi:hypothetical protein